MALLEGFAHYLGARPCSSEARGPELIDRKLRSACGDFALHLQAPSAVRRMKPPALAPTLRLDPSKVPDQAAELQRS
jgi:hypothetical protein